MGFLKKKKELKNLNSVNSFVNAGIKCGLKNKSVLNFINLLRSIKVKYPKKNITQVVNKGFDNLRVLVYIYKRKIGSKVVLIPTFRNSIKKFRKGFFIFYNSLNKRSEKMFQQKIISEFLDVLVNKGYSILERNSLYTIAIESQFNLRYAINYTLEKEYQILLKNNNITNSLIADVDLKGGYYKTIRDNDIRSFADFYEQILN